MVILITGASGGFGSKLSKYFAEKNHKLVLQSFSREVSIKEDANVFSFSCDLTNENDVELFMEKALSKFGKIDVVIHCAGISKNAIS